ncbi:hypothetical protein BZA77DRAFT_353784 [Pyronema omphalodes]|nr:hypothetical protein BZA77DRAFT_353784 [Pyronema omphalodes]
MNLLKEGLPTRYFEEHLKSIILQHGLKITFAYCQPYNDIDGRSIENVMNVSTAEPDQVRGIFHEKMARDTDAFSDRNNDTGLVSAPAESLIDKSVKATITSSVSTRIAPYTLSEAKPMEQNAPSTNKPPINIKPDPHTPYETPITVRKRSEEISPDDWLSLGPSSVFNGNSKHSQVFLKEVLPWAFSNFDNIMGNENIGTIELHMLGREREPTIWIVAGDITKVDRDFLELGLSRFGVSFATKIDKGGPKRSGNNRTQGIPWPPANGQFQQRPTCGASIGVGDNTASFGGLIQLRTTSGWTTFGITCHHFLEERARETTCAGVVNGLLGKRSYEVLQPSKHHITYDLKCMKYGYSNLSPVDESSLSEDEKQYRNVRMEKMSKNIARLEKICESRESYFGKVKFSSGYDRTSHAYPPSLFDNCTDDTLVHTMDWAIFDDIPGQRLPQENRVVGRPSNSYAEENEPVSTMVCSQFFEDVFNRSACPDAQPVANVSIPEPHRRVQGVGAITGHQDGYLATTPGLIKLEEYGKHTLEWSFCPRYKNGLGQAGDSGAWIFDDYGSVIGMILAHSDISELTYFTPIKVLFDDILEVTGATEIRVAPPLHTKGREFNNQRDPARQPTSWSPSILTPETLIETPSPGRKRKNVDMDVDSDGCEAKRPKHQNASAIKEHL